MPVPEHLRETIRLIDEAMAMEKADGYASDRREVELLEERGLHAAAFALNAIHESMRRDFERYGTIVSPSAAAKLGW